MAFLHCHSCPWKQDDFWSRRYNPLACLVADVRRYVRPRWFELDTYFAEKVYTARASRRAGQLWVHSWGMLVYRVRILVRRAWRMQWWTWAGYVKAGRPGCPQCGARLCID